ncbi:hypothetical protein AVDCRST_MAG94-1006 [uncultured Leptolyngbya sp.]|uniref:Uncharacterized protein n=1 Tax=uncultured Leptolyngbya sp. TaxID=332963 RepID=A0A6J4KR81_9CYAN|nr:hypothetical protein AVDCRST_MAG94-1006 [uncultured Leptolyngbya sp.]
MKHNSNLNQIGGNTMKRVIIATLSLAIPSTLLDLPALALNDRFERERLQTMNKLNDRFVSERQETMNK